MKRTLLLASTLALVLMSTPLSAQTAPAPAAPCRDAPARQFDFWLGRWDVFLPDGSRAGANRIEAVAGGCALLEHWQGRGGFTGHSLNRYDPASARWQQWWVDSSGALLQLSGGWQDGRMVLSGESVEGAQRRLERITWTPLPDGAVRQLWEQSTDGGRQWTVAFDGRYVRPRTAP
ncbi:hypothetical protein [Aquabacterium sp.]|uniref:hypothetical protein n=1 Tax=Aquabacterium sp. TaxID=1872578 RepID=UPI0037846CA5